MLISIFCALLMTLTAGAADAGFSLGGLPATAVPANQKMVGSVPYSTQWKYETSSSFIYLGVNKLDLATTSFKSKIYDIKAQDNTADHVSVDLFFKMFRISPEGRLSFWSRYSLGMNVKQTSLTNPDFALSSVSNHGYLAYGVTRFTPMFTFRLTSAIYPYLGAGVAAFGYRHTAGISGAELQGGGLAYEAAGGIHFPVLFDHKFSIFGEYRYTKPFKENALISAGSAAAAGLGLSL